MSEPLPARPSPVIEYPSSDGQRMAENDWQLHAILDAIGALDLYFAGHPDVYVSGDLLIYYEEGNVGARVLLLPFRLQRCRRHHQHPLDAVQLAQQGAGGDGLRGLAEPHVVGKQRPFAEREVQHALGLVRQERALEQAVERPAAGREIRLETGAGALFSRHRLPGFQPVFQAAGNAEAILAGTRRVP